MTTEPRIHPSAEVSPTASIGPGTQIWHGVQIREDASVGSSCIIGKSVYIDAAVRVGDRCKIQNNASLFHGATLEEGVFVGPHVCLTNDKVPRAITPGGTLKGADDWEVGAILLRYGCSIGACAVVLPGVTVGRFAMVGSGAVVTRSVPDHGLAVGNPARLVGFVCACGGRLSFEGLPADDVITLQRAGGVDVVPHGYRHGRCARCGLVTVLAGDAGREVEAGPA